MYSSSFSNEEVNCCYHVYCITYKAVQSGSLSNESGRSPGTKASIVYKPKPKTQMKVKVRKMRQSGKIPASVSKSRSQKTSSRSMNE